jgi:hypothetical protein
MGSKKGSMQCQAQATDRENVNSVGIGGGSTVQNDQSIKKNLYLEEVSKATIERKANTKII